MKLFECQNCAQPLYFENTRCESCELSLGYLPGRETVTALKPWRGMARLGGSAPRVPLLRKRGAQCLQLVGPGG